jgi:hypothetical protein
VLLVAVLALVPFHSGGPVPTRGGQSGRTAIQSPMAMLGIAAALLVGATVVWLALATLVPRPPLPHPGRALVPLASVAAGLVLLKLVLDPDRLANGAWLSLGLGALLVGAQLAGGARSARA